MKTIVLNETNFAQDIIRTYDLGNAPFFALVCVGRYYLAQGLCEEKIYNKLHGLANQNSQLNWNDVAEDVLSVCKRRALLNISHIPITEIEMNSIKRMEGIQRQRLLFTLLTLAKYSNYVKNDNSNWIKYDCREMFKLANISVSKIKQNLYINDLMCAGVLEYNKRIDNLDLKVLTVDDAAPVKINVYDMRNLGFQYMMHRGMSFFKCTSCGLVVKKTAGKQKYCTNCAAIINARKTIERYHAKHKNSC